LYGLVITSQVIASYATFVVDFGFRTILAKDIALNKNNIAKLSEIMSSIFFIRLLLFFTSFIFYITFIGIFKYYSNHFILFLFAFGTTLEVLLFPQFFFQGIEEMKYITFIKVGVSLVFLALIFFFIKEKSDYIFVPLLKSIGSLIGGLVAIIIILKKYKIRLKLPKIDTMRNFMLDALPVFGTQIITSIKDKFSYLLVGYFVGMSDVVVYDLGVKFISILSKPVSVLSQVLLPKIARDKKIDLIKKGLWLAFITTFILTAIFFLGLPKIMHFFLSKTNIDLMPIRIFLIAPIVLAISSFISINIFVAFGYNKYLLYNIILTTGFYLTATLTMNYFHMLNKVIVFVVISVLTYIAELVFSSFLAKAILKKRKKLLR